MLSERFADMKVSWNVTFVSYFSDCIQDGFFTESVFSTDNGHVHVRTGDGPDADWDCTSAKRRCGDGLRERLLQPRLHLSVYLLCQSLNRALRTCCTPQYRTCRRGEWAATPTFFFTISFWGGQDFGADSDDRWQRRSSLHTEAVADENLGKPRTVDRAPVSDLVQVPQDLPTSFRRVHSSVVLAFASLIFSIHPSESDKKELNESDWAQLSIFNDFSKLDINFSLNYVTSDETFSSLFCFLELHLKP